MYAIIFVYIHICTYIIYAYMPTPCTKSCISLFLSVFFLFFFACRTLGVIRFFCGQRFLVLEKCFGYSVSQLLSKNCNGCGVAPCDSIIHCPQCIPIYKKVHLSLYFPPGQGAANRCCFGAKSELIFTHLRVIQNHFQLIFTRTDRGQIWINCHGPTNFFPRWHAWRRFWI